MYRVFIGYDHNEIEAYHVLAHSIIKHASAPISIAPLKLDALPMWRERHEYQSTEFSFSRFLVPYLSGYQGWSLFMDCDMLVTDDIVEVFQLANDRYALLCTQHDYQTKHEEKFLNQLNPHYPRKNWSSFMLFNNKLCHALTPSVVNKASGLELHRFTWLPDQLIGEIPLKWNYLVGEQTFWPEKTGKKPPNNLHWTIGGPWFPDYANTEWSDLWREYRDEMTQSVMFDKEEVA